MMSCEIPKPYMLSNPVHLTVHLTIEDPDLDFAKAEMNAKKQAKSHYSDAMLLSWYDKNKERYSPYGIECCSDGNPSWVTYAKSRGSNIAIDINNEEYVFIFRGENGSS